MVPASKYTTIRQHSKQVVTVIWHKASSPPHTDNSVVFARRRQCAPHLVHPIGNRTVPVLPPAESLWVYWPLDVRAYVLCRPLFTLKTATSLGPLSNIHGSLSGHSQPAHRGVFYTDYGPFPVSYCSLPAAFWLPFPMHHSPFFSISANPAMSRESAVGFHQWGLGAKPQMKFNLMYFKSKIWRLL